MENHAKNLGQFFTPCHVAEFMIGLSRASTDAKVLEPACGEGVFLKLLAEKGFRDLVGYEVDVMLRPITDARIVLESFVSAQFCQRFDLIIGNPPYIRWKNLRPDLKQELEENLLWQRYFNRLCDYLCLFILKSVELLNDGGELIFITPEYWLNTKHAHSLRRYLTQNGFFSDWIHFNETPIFDKVASSTVIFRFVKSSCSSRREQEMRVIKYLSTQRLSSLTLQKIKTGVCSEEIEVFSRPQFVPGEHWLLAPASVTSKLEAFEDKCVPKTFGNLFNGPKYMTLGEIAEIGNGLVSGLDQAFQIPSETQLMPSERRATLPVLKAKNIERYRFRDLNRYIFLNDVGNEEELQQEFPTFYQLLQPFREQLEKRYSYNRQLNYWEWAFLRSFNLFSQEESRIFVPCKERISHKRYFRFCAVQSGIFPTQDVTAIFLKPGVRESLYYVLALLNSDQVFEWLRYKGVVKGNIVEFSEKPLASIPMRLIDWENPCEVAWHDEIAALCELYIENQDTSVLARLERAVAALF